MSGSVTGAAVEPYSITPSLGVGLNLTYTSSAGNPAGTGPRFPPDDLQWGMIVGKVMRGSDANRYILVRTGTTQLAVGGAVTTGFPGFVVGTGTGITATNTTGKIVPPGTLFWASMGP